MDAGRTWIAGLMGLVSLIMVMKVLWSTGDGDVCGNRAQSSRKPGAGRTVYQNLGRISVAEVGLALESHLLGPRSEPAAPVVNFVVLHSGLELGRDVERHFPFSALELFHRG